jgi:hypothetical protein
VFQLDITLAEDTEGYKNAITTVPCSGKTTDVPSCIWMAAVKSQARDEYDDRPNRCALQICAFCCCQKVCLRSEACALGFLLYLLLSKGFSLVCSR